MKAAPRNVWQATLGRLQEGSMRPGSYGTFHKTRQVAFKASSPLHTLPDASRFIIPGMFVVYWSHSDLGAHLLCFYYCGN